MIVMASQITSLSIVCSTIFWHKSKKTSKLHLTALCEGNPPVTSGFPSHRGSNDDSVRIWWRHQKPVAIDPEQ